MLELAKAFFLPEEIFCIENPLTSLQNVAELPLHSLCFPWNKAFLCLCCSWCVRSNLISKEIWLKLLPRKQWGLACQAKPVLWGDCLSLSLVEHLFLLTEFMPRTVAAFLLLPWQVIVIFCDLSMWSQDLADCSALTSVKLCLLASTGMHNQAVVSSADGNCGDLGFSNLIYGCKSWWELGEDCYCDLAGL